MTNIVPMRATEKKPRSAEPPIDLERVIWDPEYRAQVRDRLNSRSGPPAKRPPTRRRRSA